MTALQILTYVAAWAGALVTVGGGAVAIAYALFKFLGQRWIEAKFDERLESFKHEKSKELEDLKYSINSLFNRTIKLHNKEFEVLPIAWGKLNSAYQALGRATFAMKEYPDLDHMSEEEVMEFLEGQDIAKTTKSDIVKSKNRINLYGKVIEYKDIYEAHKIFNEFHSYITGTRIFLLPDLKEKFDQIDNLMLEMWISRKVGKDSGKYIMDMDKYMANDKAVKNIMLEIERLVSNRLYPPEVVEGTRRI